MADPVQLQQLVFNLITNGLEALAGYRSDGVLRIASAVVGDGVEICVDDNGPGIAADERERVFDAFHTTKIGGMGMGLAICNSVVQAHGGQLQALVSELGVPDSPHSACESFLACSGLFAGTPAKAGTGLHQRALRAA